MDKFYRVDCIESEKPEDLAEKLEVLLNERFEDGYILDKVENTGMVVNGISSYLVVTVSPPEPEVAMMTPNGPIPIIGS
jgi:hypothetical protein